MGKSKKKKDKLFVLFAEDSTDVVEFMIDVIEEQGCSVDWVPDGYQAFTKIDNSTYDLIITDFDMGRYSPDGLEVVEYAQGSDRNSEAVTVVWSGLDRTYDANRRGIEVDFILTKDKIEKVEEVIEHVRKSR